nr:unnamed protein product [Callosobruchus analis]
MDNSSSEESSSDYSTESSEDDGMETAQINDVKLQLPQGLCEKQEIFRDIISTEVWNSLSDENRQHLQTFLPNFPENDELEKTKTLQRLFDFDVFHFNSPLVKFHDNLKAGYFRPDIARMQKIIQKAEQKESKYRYKTFREQLKFEVLESRNKLLAQIKNLPPGQEPRQELRKSNVDYVSHRTKRRYFQIVSSIRSKTEDPGCSSDENYPDGPPVPLPRKQKRHLNSIKNCLSNSKEKLFTSTMTAKLNGASVDLETYITPNRNPFYVNDESYKHLLYQHRRWKCESLSNPELNTKGITLKDVIRRTQLPYNKNLLLPMKHDSKIISRKRIKREHVNGRSLEIVKKAKNSYDRHSTNSDTDSDSAVNAASINSLKHNFKVNKLKLHLKKLSPSKSKVEVKNEAPSNPDTGKQVSLPTTANPINSSNSEPAAPPSTSSTSSYYNTITPVKIEDLEGIDVMNIPIDLENTDIDILDLNNKPELMQETHANFFSLIRDIICSTSEHRMNLYTLQERWRKIQQLGLASEYKNQQSPLGNWLNHLFGLTFLPPAEVGECFTQDFMSDKPQDSKVDQFTDYLVDTYVDSDSKFPPEIWAENSCSIFRTTNTCESFHSKFKRENLSPYPNIHSFVKVLTEMQTDTYIKLNSIKRHEKKYIRRETLLKQQFIQSKIMQLNRHGISRYNFVKCVSYKFSSVVNL